MLERERSFSKASIVGKIIEVCLSHPERKSAHVRAIHGKHIERAKLNLGILLPGVQRAEVGDAIDAEHHRPRRSITNCLWRFFSALSTIQGYPGGTVVELVGRQNSNDFNMRANIGMRAQ